MVPLMTGIETAAPLYWITVPLTGTGAPVHWSDALGTVTGMALVPLLQPSTVTELGTAPNTGGASTTSTEVVA